MPNALLEAMNHGIPPVVSDTSGGALDVVRNGETGLVVPVDDVSALATALKRLSAHKNARERIGAAAQAEIRAQNFNGAIATWETVTRLA